jgi:hypothetical protein
MGGNAEAETDNPELQAFQYRLECLKLEIDLVDRAMARLETITQSVKNFALITWAGSVAIFLGQADLRKYTAATALLPLLFWLIDAWWSHLNRGAFLRLAKISQFLNSDSLTESFRQNRLIEFAILDVYGHQYRETKEYYLVAGFSRIICYKEFVLLYGGLAILSIMAGVLAVL